MRTQNREKRYEFFTMATIIAGVYFLCEIGLHYDNIGSWTGLLVSITLALKWSHASQWDAWKAAHSKATSVLRGCCGLLAGCAVITLGVMTFGIPANDVSEDAVVIILGTGVDSDGKPSILMQGRVDAAVDYLKSHSEAPIIVSGGGIGGDIPITEAESMKQALINAGIDESRIYLEDQSTSTAENLRYSAELIHTEGLSTHVVIVTSNFHAYRSCLYAKRNGLTARAVTSSTPWWSVGACVIREMYGILDSWLIHRI